MRIAFIVIVLNMCFGVGKSQTFLYSPAKTYTYNISPTDPQGEQISFQNNTSSTFNVVYRNNDYSFPALWTVGVCDTYNCMGGINPGNWVLDSIKPGESFYIQLTINANSVEGSGYLRVHLWRQDVPRVIDTLLWIVTAKSVGVEELSATEIKAYPNPVKDKISFFLKEDSRVNVTDQTGRVVKDDNMKAGQSEMDFSLLQPGLYYLSIVSDKKRSYKKIIKE